MLFDKLEAAKLDKTSINLNEKLDMFQDKLKSGLEVKNGVYLKVSDKIADNVKQWLDIPRDSDQIGIEAHYLDVKNIVKIMLDGIPLENGRKSLGLRDMLEWKTNPEFQKQLTKQWAGFAAEIIGVAKDNLNAKLCDSDVKTYRADDRPDLYPRNDQYVDKIRTRMIDGEEIIVERIQVKFVGNNPEECLGKLMSKKFDKYFNDGLVDKMEVPKEFYDGIKEMLPEKIKGYEKQLQRVTELEKQEEVLKYEGLIERCKKIDSMLEKSTVTVKEAVEAVERPNDYCKKIFR